MTYILTAQCCFRPYRTFCETILFQKHFNGPEDDIIQKTQALMTLSQNNCEDLESKCKKFLELSLIKEVGEYRP